MFKIKTIISLIFLFNAIALNNTYAQKNFSFKITDKDFNSLPYCSVYSNEKGTYSNEDGIVILKINKGDSITISSIGYYSKKIIITDSLQDSVIKLKSNTTNLKEVTITTNKPKKIPKKIIKEIGYHNSKHSSKYSGCFGLLSEINIKHYECFRIKNVIIKIAKNKTNHKKNAVFRETLVRLLIYNKKENQPNKNILSRDITKRVKKHDQEIRFNIIEDEILLKKDTFIGIEYIGYYTSDNVFIPFQSSDEEELSQFNISYTRQLMNVKSWYKETITGNWVKLSNYTHINFRIGIEVIDCSFIY